MLAITADNFSRRLPELAAGLDPDCVARLLDACSVQEAVAGEALITESTPADALYLVWDGALDVSMRTPAGEREVAEVAQGTLLGEVSLLDPGPATATVRTKQGCTALRWTGHTSNASPPTIPRWAQSRCADAARRGAARGRRDGGPVRR